MSEAHFGGMGTIVIGVALGATVAPEEVLITWSRQGRKIDGRRVDHQGPWKEEFRGTVLSTKNRVHRSMLAL